MLEEVEEVEEVNPPIHVAHGQEIKRGQSFNLQLLHVGMTHDLLVYIEGLYFQEVTKVINLVVLPLAICYKGVSGSNRDYKMQNREPLVSRLY